MPHLRALVERYENEPFAVIGINCYDDEDAFKRGVQKYDVSWISAYQGETVAPIAELYQVRGFPTYVLIDHEGKIVTRGNARVDDRIEALVAAAREAGR